MSLYETIKRHIDLGSQRILENLTVMSIEEKFKVKQNTKQIADKFKSSSVNMREPMPSVQNNSLIRKTRLSKSFSDLNGACSVSESSLFLSNRESDTITDKLRKNNAASVENLAEKPVVEISKSKYTIDEIVNTEKDYVNDLDIIVYRYRDLMRQNSQNEIKMPKGLEDGKDNFVFGNICEIYEWHKNVFYPKLVAAVNCETNCLNKICQLFISHELKFTKLYARFCKNKPKSEYIVVEFQGYFDWLRSRLNEKFSLSDYLIKPVQRITKYYLLIKSLKDHVLKEGIETNADFNKAIRVMSRKTNEILVVLAFFCRGRLENYDGDVPDELILHDTLFVNEFEGVLKDKKIAKIVSFERRKVFLFEQKLIFSDIIESDIKFVPPRYVFKKEIKTNQFDLTVYSEMKFILTMKNTNPARHFLCVCEHNYKKWIRKLEDIIEQENYLISSLEDPQSMQRSSNKGL